MCVLLNLQTVKARLEYYRNLKMQQTIEKLISTAGLADLKIGGNVKWVPRRNFWRFHPLGQEIIVEVCTVALFSYVSGHISN